MLIILIVSLFLMLGIAIVSIKKFSNFAVDDQKFVIAIYPAFYGWKIQCTNFDFKWEFGFQMKS